MHGVNGSTHMNKHELTVPINIKLRSFYDAQSTHGPQTHSLKIIHHSTKTSHDSEKDSSSQTKHNYTGNIQNHEGCLPLHFAIAPAQLRAHCPLAHMTFQIPLRESLLNKMSLRY